MGRSRTKAIAQTVSSDGAGKEQSTASVVGLGVMVKMLSPRQAYELNVTARKAVSSIADQIAKAKRRLFDRRTGDEITSGEAYEFLRKNVNSDAIRAMVSWWNVEGEIATWKVGSELGKPRSLVVLDPGQMMPLPLGVFSPEMQTGWQYTYGQTISGGSLGPVKPMIELPVDQVMFTKNWNPIQPYGRLRGSSPMQTGIQEVSGNYFANRYNTAFFQNGASADIIIRFPKGTNKKDAEDWVKKWEAKHGVFQGRSFKVSAIIGEEVQIETPAQTAKDGQFMQLRQMNSEDIGGLFGVPPSVMGFLSRTRFDTIDLELESFFENTLMPQMDVLNGYIQSQLLDTNFASNKGTDRQKPEKRLSAVSREALQRAMDNTSSMAGESDLVFMLDPDSLPIAAKLRLKQLESADTYRRTQAVSFADAAEWSGLDRTTNDADDLIFIDSDQQKVMSPEDEQAKLDAQTAIATANATNNPNNPPEGDPVKALAARVKALEEPDIAKANKHHIKLLRCHYSLVKSAVSDGTFTKAIMESSGAKAGMDKRQIAADHLSLMKLIKDGNKDGITEFFRNAIGRDNLMKIIG